MISIFCGILLTEVLAFQRKITLDNKNDAIVAREEKCCAYNVWKKRGSGKKRWKGWEKGEVARWRDYHRLNTPTRDPEGQGVSPVWNATGTRWRTTSRPFSYSSSLFLPLSFPPFLSLSSAATVTSTPSVLIPMNSSLLIVSGNTACSLNDELLLLVLNLLFLSFSLSFSHPLSLSSCRSPFKFSSRVFYLCVSLSLLNRLHFNSVFCNRNDC